jgi:hypothetical protein
MFVGEVLHEVVSVISFVHDEVGERGRAIRGACGRNYTRVLDLFPLRKGISEQTSGRWAWDQPSDSISKEVDKEVRMPGGWEETDARRVLLGDAPLH